jgi:hypothetical protein
VAPQLVGVAAGDDLEEVMLMPGNRGVGPVEGSYQLVVAKAVRGSHWLSSVGPGFAALVSQSLPEHMFDCKATMKQTADASKLAGGFAARNEDG